MAAGPSALPCLGQGRGPGGAGSSRGAAVQGRRVPVAQGYRSHPVPVGSRFMFAWPACLFFLFLAARRLPKGTRGLPQLLLALLFMLSYCSVDDMSCAEPLPSGVWWRCQPLWPWFRAVCKPISGDVFTRASAVLERLLPAPLTPAQPALRGLDDSS